MHLFLTFLEVCHFTLMFPLINTVDLVQISKEPVCSHQPLEFNCTTNGPALAWIVNEDYYVFNSEAQINTTKEDNGFIFGFMDIKSSKFFANLTIERVLSKHNGTRITCSDGMYFKPKDVIVAGMVKIKLILIIVLQSEKAICSLILLY